MTDYLVNYRRTRRPGYIPGVNPYPYVLPSSLAVITIDESKCGTADSTNFPMYFGGTYDGTGGEPDLRTVANGGRITSDNGYDISFYSDADCTDLLDFERVGWSATTGLCEFWVRIPTLSSSTDTVIYMKYGDSSVITDLQDKAGTWNSNFGLVSHQPDGSTLSAVDSTTYGNSGSITGATAEAGKVDGGASFDGNDYITYPFPDGVASTHTFTITMWAKHNTTLSLTNMYNLSDGVKSLSINYWYSTGQMLCGLNGTYWSGLHSDVNVANWHLYHFVADDLGARIKIYADGVDQTIAGAGSLGNVVYNTFDISRGLGGAYQSVMSSDEVRVLNTDVSTSWITSEYNNQSSPSTFYTIT